MPRQPDPTTADADRAHWTGLDPADLRALERSPLDPRTGFDVPERVPGVEEVPAVGAVLAILHVLGDEGVPVGFDGSFDAATVRAIGERLGRDDRGETDAPYVGTARRLAEAAALIERRLGRARVTTAGRRFVAEGGDALLSHLLRAWTRRPLEASDRFGKAVHATWPLTVLLLHRFGDRWLSPRFYAAVAALLTPAAIDAAPGADDIEAREAFLDAYVVDVLLRFAAFLGLVELSTSDDPDEEPELRATWLLDALLPLTAHQAPASDVVDDWEAADDEDADGEDAAWPTDDGEPGSWRENPAAVFNRELEAAIAERDFETKEDLEAFIEAFVARRNAAPIEEFDGLSADAMQHLLHDPFSADSPLVVADVLRSAPRSALLHLVLDLAEALGDAGLKATANGNLPRAHVLAALVRYQEAGWHISPYLSVRNEEDFDALHVARLVARMAGLVTLRGGRWHTTRAFRRTLDRSGAAGVYAALFRAFVTKYAWNSADLYPELGIVQASWAFSLLQLLRHGAAWRDGEFYTERFVRAYPLAVDEAAAAVGPASWLRDPRDAVRDAYEVRVLERFAEFLGLAEVERGTYSEDYGRVLRVRATPALADVVAERMLSQGAVRRVGR